jgi:hypothetical protein
LENRKRAAFQTVAAAERKINGVFREHSRRLINFPRTPTSQLTGFQMLRFSLVVAFIMSLATLTVAASSLPVPPEGIRPGTTIVAELG